MRYSFTIASLYAAVAIASPLHKRGVEVAAPAEDVVAVTNVVAVTVTAAPVIVTEVATAVVQATTSSPAGHHGHSHSQAAPAPAPTSSSEAVVVVTTTQAPATSAAVETTSSPAVVATTAAATTVASSATDSLAATAVSYHNQARASHGAIAMEWNQTLADIASQETSCDVFAHILSVAGGGYGQNIAVAGSSSADAYSFETALGNSMTEWYAEESIYDALYGVASPVEGAEQFLHFTQMVWKDTISVGCAVVSCGSTNGIYPGMTIWYTTCNYYPAGNVETEFAQNVLAS